MFTFRLKTTNKDNLTPNSKILVALNEKQGWFTLSINIK